MSAGKSEAQGGAPLWFREERRGQELWPAASHRRDNFLHGLAYSVERTQSPGTRRLHIGGLAVFGRFIHVNECPLDREPLRLVSGESVGQLHVGIEFRGK